MTAKNKLKLFALEGKRREPQNSHRSAKLVALVGVLVLAIACSSVGLAAGPASTPDLERSLEASAKRWQGLGEAYEAARAEAAATAMTNRYVALAAYYNGHAAAIVSDFDADTARWSKRGEAYEAARAEAAATAMTARYNALAEPYVEKTSREDTRGSYSGDDAYDQAAGSRPERSLAGVKAATSNALSGGYSGDDDYDPAAGGNPPVLGR